MGWPSSKIISDLDNKPDKLDKTKFSEVLSAGGYGKSLADFLFGLYENANGGTFYDGAFRVLPLEGYKQHKVPDLVEWNDPTDWKQSAPKEGHNIFYFCSNAFGDLFGVPLDSKKEVTDDKFCILWTEKYVFEKAALGWDKAFTAFLNDEGDTGKYLARIKEYKQVVAKLGKPKPWECFSSKAPEILGGENVIENVEIRPLGIHVSFTLQAIHQHKNR